MKVKKWLQNKYLKVRNELLPSNVGGIDSVFNVVRFGNIQGKETPIVAEPSESVLKHIKKGDFKLNKLIVLLLPFARKVTFISIYDYKGEIGYDVDDYMITDKKVEIIVQNIIYHIKNTPDFSFKLFCDAVNDDVVVEHMLFENVKQAKKSMKKLIGVLNTL